MKKTILFVLVLLTMTLLITACGKANAPSDDSSTQKPTEKPDEAVCVHEIITDEAVAPTCTEAGKSEGSHCKKCGEVLTAQTEISAKGHTEVTAKAVAATCTKGGVTAGKRCAECDLVIQEGEPTDPIKHKFKDGFCSVCNTPKHSQGLWLTLSADETYYIVNDIGDCRDKELIIPEIYNEKPVKKIVHMAFAGEESLVKLVIPDSVTEIESKAFQYCTSLKEVVIGKGVTELPNMLFYQCTSLESITFGGKITSFGKDVFEECRSIQKVHIADIASWCSVTFQTELGSPLVYGGDLYCNDTLITELVIPDGVTKIGKHAFRNCHSIVSIVFSESVAEIEEAAFRHCTSLQSVTIPASVKRIGMSAFYECTSLESVTLENGVAKLSSYAFGKCSSLTEIVIPESVTTISYNIFDSCTSLIAIYLETDKNLSEFNRDWKKNCNATEYWGDAWQYVDGVPTLK